MNVLKYRVSLDMFDTHSQTTIKAKKSDSACQIHITLSEKGKIYNIGEGCSATFNARKSDGNFIYDNCTIENNTIVYDFTSSVDENGVCQVSACEGIVECEVTLYNADGKQLTSPRFTLFIDGTVYNGEEIASTPQSDFFKEIVAEAVAPKMDKFGEVTLTPHPMPEYGSDYIAAYVKLNADNFILLNNQGDKVFQLNYSTAGELEVYRNINFKENYTISNLPTPSGANVLQAANVEFVKQTQRQTETYANNTFAPAIKNTVSGGVLAVHDVSPVEHDLDVRVRSKNLIPYPYFQSSISANSGNFTVNEDCSITASGVPTNYVGIKLYDGKPIVTKGNITMHFDVVDSISNVTMNLNLYDDSNNKIALFYCYEKNIATLNLDNYPTASRWMLTVDRNASNKELLGTFYPVIELGSTATEYTPYIADLSSVEVSRYGENLLPYPYYDITKTISGITYTVGENGSLTIEGTATTNATFNFILANYNSALPLKAGNYTLSLGTPNTSYTQFRLGTITESGSIVVKADIRYAGEKEKTFTLEQDTRIYMNCIVGKGDTVPKTTFYPMLEIGSTATVYEPYKEPQTATANADGTVEGLTSLSPNMTLVSDTEGVVINLEYNVDTKMYIDNKFNELATALLNA